MIEPTVMLHDADDHESEREVFAALGVELDAGHGLRVDYACPQCEVAPLELLAVGSPYWGEHKTWVTVGCAGCGRHVGTASWERPTIFGADEDEAVLNGRARVYGRERVGGHGDRAAEQHAREIEIKRKVGS